MLTFERVDELIKEGITEANLPDSYEVHVLYDYEKMAFDIYMTYNFYFKHRYILSYSQFNRMDNDAERITLIRDIILDMKNVFLIASFNNPQKYFEED